MQNVVNFHLPDILEHFRQFLLVLSHDTFRDVIVVVRSDGCMFIDGTIGFWHGGVLCSSESAWTPITCSLDAVLFFGPLGLLAVCLHGGRIEVVVTAYLFRVVFVVGVGKHPSSNIDEPVALVSVLLESFLSHLEAAKVVVVCSLPSSI